MEITSQTPNHSSFGELTRTEMLQFYFDNVSLGSAAERIGHRAPGLPFNYVVTPNVDHINRVFLDQPDLLSIYHSALFCLCDSRVLSMMARWIQVDLPVVPGSSLVATLFERHVRPDDALTIIGGTSEMVSLLRAKYGLTNVSHYNPPMGFIKNAAAVDACVDYVVQHPARFVFLAVGSPQQEILAHRITQSGQAFGIGLCVGAALNLLVGIERRAPVWMQKRGLEWLHRLLENPERLWHRYLIRGPRIFALFVEHEILGSVGRHGKGIDAVSGRNDALVQ